MRTYAGDHLGLDFPADPASLSHAGPSFLTDAFRRAGSLATDNEIVAVDDLQEFRGGSTGRKAVLTVSYRRPCDLPRELFVKFSRDFDDPARDLGRAQMAHEVQFALLTRTPELPIAVPRCLYADFHAGSGSGILVTARIPFGRNGIERQYEKCADHSMPEPVEHYRALFSALGALAGSQKAGRLGMGSDFAVDIRSLSVGQRAPYSVEQLQRRVDHLAELAVRQPALLPTDVAAPEFLSRLRDEVGVISGRVDILWEGLAAEPDHIGLCHWNANVDNAWFWRQDGGLRCGLLDWGCVGQMNLAMALWGAMCSAETAMWNNHFDGLLDHFLAEYTAAGGPVVDPAALRRHLLTYVALMGTAWLLDVPGYLLKLLPEPVPDRFDPRIAGSEQARSRLLMMTNFLNLWQRWDVTDVLGGVAP